MVPRKKFRLAVLGGLLCGNLGLSSSARAAIFADVGDGHPFRVYIERIYELGVTSGCGVNPLRFCPDAVVTRGQMAVFVLRGREGGGYMPPPGVGVFSDVPVGHMFGGWVEELYRRGVTSGCGVDPLRYCPDAAVTRGQMAVFLLRGRYGAGYQPPAATGGVFADVPVGHPFAAWIEQLAREGITRGCAPNLFCPDAPVTRGQMAVFLSRNFTLLPPAQTAWRQHGCDAARTGYTPETVSHPWQWLWAWNGPNATGGVAKRTTSGTLPRNVQPVTGGGRVYLATGLDGVVALDAATGAELWWQRNVGNVRSTVAYDPQTDAVFALSSDGVLRKLRASDGAVVGQFASGKSSDLPLPPALLEDRVVFSMGDSVFAVRKDTLTLLWVYPAGASVVVPPAYAISRDLVIVATEPDLYVHAIRNRDGSQAWRVRPVHPSRSVTDPTEYRLGWPVVADNAGVVLIKVRLDWQVLWRTWPQDNAGMRALLAQNPGEQALFALRLDDGSTPYVVNVGHGGYGDSDYLPMGPQPVVKRFVHGREVAYTVIRATHVYDPRWDSHFGEVLLDSTTVPGYTGGDVRFIAFDWPPGSANPFLLTDEQPFVTMAGDTLFGAHWEAVFALRILDRSPSRGSFANRITSQRLSTVVTSQDDVGACAFSPSHYCPSGLANTRSYDFGFYVYYNQGPVYDQYWSEFATAVVSEGRLFVRMCDGSVVALAPASAAPSSPASPPPDPVAPASIGNAPGIEPVAVIPVEEARSLAGRVVTVEGRVAYLVDNGKHLLLAFSRPHQGTFKAILRHETEAFRSGAHRTCRGGSLARVTGLVRWYQGDPAVFVEHPNQLQCHP